MIRCTALHFASFACAALIGLQSAFAQPVPSKVEKWKGEIDLVQARLPFVVAFTVGEGSAVSATLDIPLQGVKAAPMSDVTYSATDIRFTFQVAGAVFSATRGDDPASATGNLEQAGQKFKMTLSRMTEAEVAAAERKRPQTPKPPFPYEQREVTYANAADKTKLAATLTLPRGPGPFPAIVLITGSGPQDRDETILDHKPFAVIADHLTRQGIAVLRADDRGVGGSTGNIAESTADNFAGDVLAAIDLLKNTPEVDARHIGLLGHSEGGIVAPMVAARSSDVSFIILLAGTGLRGDRILIMQLEAVLKASGVPEDNIRKQIDAQTKALEAAVGNADDATLRELLRKLIELQSGGAVPIPDEAVAPHLAQLRTAWFRSFLVLDPAVALRKVRCPVLALNGTLDTQVPYEPNLRSIEAALKEAGNTDVTTKPLPGLNHLFQKATTGGPQEYDTIEETIAPEVLTQISDWVKAKTKK